MAVVIVLLVIIGIIAFLIANMYNTLVRLRQRVFNAWSQIEVQLKQRYDLVPNLVATVKGYAKHESETLEKVVQARAAAVNASEALDKSEAESAFAGSLMNLFAVAERYPELKANENFLQLQNQLADLEKKISLSRSIYNDTVQKINTMIQMFPTNIFAQMFGFKLKDYYNLDDAPESREPVKVEF